MAYITGDIVSLVQKRIRDTGYDTSEIKSYLNDTQNDIFNEYRLPFMETTASYTTVANVADITNGVGLPANYDQAIDLIDIVNYRVIPYKEFRDVDILFQSPNSANTGPISQGIYWSLYGQTMILAPTPSQSYSLTLRYYKKPTLLVNDSDVPSLPSQFQEIYVVGAAYRIMQVKDNFDQAGVYQNKYDEILQKLVNKTAVKQVGVAAQMRINRYHSPKRQF